MAYGLHREMSLFGVDRQVQHLAPCFSSHNLLCHNRTIAALLFLTQQSSAGGAQ
jgi:hypothetical protein